MGFLIDIFNSDSPKNKNLHMRRKLRNTAVNCGVPVLFLQTIEKLQLNESQLYSRTSS